MTIDLSARFAAFQRHYPLCACVVNDQIWEYIASGEGEVLLLLPGFFGVAQTNFLYVLNFERCYRVVSVNYPEAGVSIAELVEGLAGFMDQLGVAQAHLLGGSYSGYVAQVFVRRYPQRVRTLILAQTGAPRARHLPVGWALNSLLWLLPHSVLRGVMRRSMRYFLPHASPQQTFWRAHFVELIQAFSQRSLRHRFWAALDYHRRYRFAPTDLAEWRGAILILEASHESMMAADDAALLRRLYPQAQCEIIPGDHLRAVDQPEAQITAIAQFLRQAP